MKIALFHNLHSGGALRAFYELSRRLSEKHRLDLYTIIKDKNRQQKFPFNGFVNHAREIQVKLPGNFLLLQKYLMFEYGKVHRSLAGQINKKDYDLAFLTHDYLTKSPYLLRYLKTPSVYLCHEPFREFYEPSVYYYHGIKYSLINFMRRPLKRVDEVNVSKANIVMTNSQYSVSRLEKIYRRSVQYLPLGIDNQIFKPNNNKPQHYYLTVGALARFKGIGLLLHSISLLPKKFQYPLIVVADGGRDYPELQDLALKLKVNMVVKSNIDDSQLIRFYNNSALYLNGSYYEPFGLSMLEAIGCGCRVISVKEGGVTDFIKEGINGYYSTRSPHVFQSQIQKALNIPYNKKTVSQSVRLWTWKRSVTKLEEYFKSAHLAQ